MFKTPKFKSSLKRFIKHALAAMLASILLIPLDFTDPEKYLQATGVAAVAGFLGFLEKYLRWTKEAPTQ